jgi:hypothetical protein
MRTLVLALAALSLAASAHAAAPAAKTEAKPPAKAAAKPASKPAAPAKPAATATKPAAGVTPALKVANFDARDPDRVIALLAALGAKGAVTKSENGQVFLNIATPGGDFGAQMIGCDGKGKACTGLAFFTAFDRKGPNLAQINDFNRAQFACRGFMNPAGQPGVMYATLVNLRMTADETRQHLGVWQGCLASFSDFTRDPVAFLSVPHT